MSTSAVPDAVARLAGRATRPPLSGAARTVVGEVYAPATAPQPPSDVLAHPASRGDRLSSPVVTPAPDAVSVSVPVSVATADAPVAARPEAPEQAVPSPPPAAQVGARTVAAAARPVASRPQVVDRNGPRPQPPSRPDMIAAAPPVSVPPAGAEPTAAGAATPTATQADMAPTTLDRASSVGDVAVIASPPAPLPVPTGTPPAAEPRAARDAPAPPTTPPPPPVVIGQISVEVAAPPGPAADPFAGCRLLESGLTARRGGGW